MKKLLLKLLLIFISTQSFSQSKIDENETKIEFLNFDLTKNLIEFGYSKTSLQEVLTPINLEYLKRYNTHFLSSFDFDKEVAVFKKNGFIAYILLEKKFGQESNLNNEINSKEFYSEVIPAINSKYGIYSNSTTRKTEWVGSNYKIFLNIESDNTVILAYNNLLKKDLKKNSKISNERAETPVVTYTNQKEKKERTKRLENFLNQFLQVYSQIGIRSFAKLNGEIMEIYFEREEDLTPSNEEFDLQKEIKKLEKNSFNDLAEHFILKTCNSKKDLEILSQTLLKRIKFIQDIYYKDGTESHLTSSIYIDELLRLSTPLRKKEILDIMY